jgi:DNA-binding HxlR family transcriptional regulator
MTPDCVRRSSCPLSIALEIFGDKWTLLILRDLLFKQATSFKDFQASDEQIASNILADRLSRLSAAGIVSSARSPDDARVILYRPTSKGLDLLPVLVEAILWAARYEQTAAPAKLLKRMREDREGFMRTVRERFSPRSER